LIARRIVLVCLPLPGWLYVSRQSNGNFCILAFAQSDHQSNTCTRALTAARLWLKATPLLPPILALLVSVHYRLNTASILLALFILRTSLSFSDSARICIEAMLLIDAVEAERQRRRVSI
jgi:dolichol kinase